MHRRMNESPPRLQRQPLHNFKLPDDLKWKATKIRDSYNAAAAAAPPPPPPRQQRTIRHSKRSRSPSSSADGPWTERQSSEHTDDLLAQITPAMQELDLDPKPKPKPSPGGSRSGKRSSPRPTGETPGEPGDKILHGERPAEPGGVIIRTPPHSGTQWPRWVGESPDKDGGANPDSSLLSRIPSHRPTPDAPFDPDSMILESTPPLSRSPGENPVESGSVIFKSPPVSGDSSASSAKKPPSIRIKLPKTSGTPSKTSGTPSKPRSSRDSRRPVSKTGGCSSSGGPPHVSFNVIDQELEAIDLLNSGFARDKNFSPVNLDDEDHRKDEFDREKSMNKGEKKEEVPIKTYVRSSKKGSGQGKEMKKPEEMLMEFKKIEEERKKAEDDDSIDLDAKIWNLRTRKPSRPKSHQAQFLGTKNTGTTSPTEPKFKQAAGTGSGDRDNRDSNRNSDESKDKNVEENNTKDGSSGEKKKDQDEKKKEEEEKKDKGKGKQPMKDKEEETDEEYDEEEEKKEEEEETSHELRLPKFRVQLTQEEIEEDLYALGIGQRPQRKSSSRKRPQKVQRNIDQVTPGIWLEYIDMDRYKVPAETASKNNKKKSKSNSKKNKNKKKKNKRK